MGLFNEIRSSYNLTEEFTNKTLQTKDLDSCLDLYWIDTVGRLFLIDLSKTADVVNSNVLYSKKDFPLFKWIPNGNHGKVKPVYINKYVEVYNNPYRRCKIHFKNGIVQNFEVIDLKYEL